ncbi:hypothetical protein IT413_05855 [Candidatus Peregrinibacteria bacterium]|nr:hypothetical protein [Candidatus Peregrinibacteria bacterium]
MKKFLQKIPNWLQWSFVFIAGTLMMMWPAIYNGFPLVFSDTGTFVYTAFTFFPPMERSIGYGVFVRLATLGISLWGVVLVQSLLLVYLIIRSLQLFSPKIPTHVVFLVLLTIALLTPAPWFASQIMADIFAPMLVMTTGLFIFGVMGVKEKVGLLLLLIFSLGMHTAHAMILLFTLAATAILAYRVFVSAQQVLGWYMRMAIVAGALIVTVIGLMNMNLNTYGQFTLNPSGHAFLMARLAETPLLKDYLVENCVVNEWKLCQAIPELPYTNVEQFLWWPASVVHNFGWLESKPEYDRIIQGILSNPMHLGYFAVDSLDKGMHLLTFFKMDSFYPQKVNSPPYRPIKKYFPQEIGSFTSARQFHDQLYLLPAAEMIHFISFLWSCLLLIYVALKGFGSKTRPFIVLIISGVIVNAFIMGGLSGVFGRYQARICWLIVFVAIAAYLTSDKKGEGEW